MWDTLWINNEEKELKIKSINLTEYLINGWKQGRLKRCHIHKENKTKFIPKSQLKNT